MTRIIILFCMLLCAACKPSLVVPVPSKGLCNTNNIMVVGGSYMAGVQNGALSNKSQKSSIAALIVEQMNKAGIVKLKFPLLDPSQSIGISNNGNGFETETQLTYEQLPCDTFKSFKPVRTYIGNAVVLPLSDASFYDRTTVLASMNLNVSFPYATCRNYFQTNQYIRPGVENPFFKAFVSEANMTPLGFIKGVSAPTFSIISLGMDDVYSVASMGADYTSQTNFSLPSTDSFAIMLDLVLKSTLRSTPKGVITTIPRLEYFPAYNLVPAHGLSLSAQKADDLNNLYGNIAALHFVEGSNGFIAESETGVLTALHPKKIKLLEASEKIILTIPLDSLKCDGLGVIKPILGKYVLDKAELQQIETTIENYNQIIIDRANKYGLALVDLNLLYAKINSGVNLNGALTTGKFISGGFFSLDGYTLTDKGNALVANACLSAINSTYRSTFPLLNPNDYVGVSLP